MIFLTLKFVVMLLIRKNNFVHFPLLTFPSYGKQYLRLRSCYFDQLLIYKACVSRVFPRLIKLWSCSIDFVLARGGRGGEGPGQAWRGSRALARCRGRGGLGQGARALAPWWAQGRGSWLGSVDGVCVGERDTGDQGESCYLDQFLFDTAWVSYDSAHLKRLWSYSYVDIFYKFSNFSFYVAMRNIILKLVTWINF